MVFQMIKNKGFTLIEVLVTVIILSISLLGLVALQSVSNFSTYEARQKTIAVYVANDLMERIRVNKSSWMNIIIAAGENGMSDNTENQSYPSSQPSCSEDDNLNDCSDENRMNDDLFKWKSVMEQSINGTSLYSPVGCINAVKITGKEAATIQIVISWQDKEELKDSADITQISCGAVGRKHRQFVLESTL